MSSLMNGPAPRGRDEHQNEPYRRAESILESRPSTAALLAHTANQDDFAKAGLDAIPALWREKDWPSVTAALHKSIEPQAAALGDILRAHGDLQTKWSLQDFARIGAGLDPQLKRLAAMSFLAAVLESAATQTQESSVNLGLSANFRLSRDITHSDVEDALLERIERALKIANP